MNEWQPNQTVELNRNGENIWSGKWGEYPASQPKPDILAWYLLDPENEATDILAIIR